MKLNAGYCCKECPYPAKSWQRFLIRCYQSQACPTLLSDDASRYALVYRQSLSSCFAAALWQLCEQPESEPHQRLVQQSCQAVRRFGQLGQNGQGPTFGRQSFAAPGRALWMLQLVQKVRRCQIHLQLRLCPGQYPAGHHFVCLHVTQIFRPCSVLGSVPHPGAGAAQCHFEARDGNAHAACADGAPLPDVFADGGILMSAPSAPKVACLH